MSAIAYFEDKQDIEKDRTALRDSLLIMVLALILAAISFNTSLAIASVSLWALCLLYFFSGNEPMWLVLFLVIISPIAELFPGPYGLQMIPVGNHGISFVRVIHLFMFFKALRIRKSTRTVNYFSICSVLFVALIIEAFVVGAIRETSSKQLMIYLVNLIPFLSLYSVPRLLSTEENWNRFFRRMFYIMLFIVIIYIFEHVFMQKIAFLLGATKVSTGFGVNLTAEDEFSGTARLFSSPFLVILCFISTISFYKQATQRFRNEVLIYVALMAAFICFASATRGYILAFLLIFILSAVHSRQVALRIRGAVAIIIFALLLYLIMSEITLFQNIFSNSIDRLSTLIALLNGDLTAGGTLTRLTTRAAHVNAGIALFPVFGTGFSDLFREYYDGHVGNLCLILQHGYVGFALWLIIWLVLFGKMYYRFLTCSSDNTYRFPLAIWSFGFLAIILIHSSSATMFSLSLNSSAQYFLCIFFSYYNFIYGQSLRFDHIHSGRRMLGEWLVSTPIASQSQSK